jgi:hypothetical protein
VKDEHPAWPRLRELLARQDALCMAWVNGEVSDTDFRRRDAALTARIRELKEELGIANHD